MPNRGNRRSGGKKNRPKSNSSGPSRVVQPLLKAITDLKVATVLTSTPRIPDIPRMLFKEKVFTIIQNANLGTISTSATVVSSGALQFALSESPIATSLSGVFDTYRLEQVTLRFVPQILSFAAGSFYPPLLTVLDYDDGTSLLATSVARAYDTVCETTFGRYVERTLRPKVATAIYSGSAFTAFAQASNWVDCANATAPWYGVKWIVDSGTNALTAAYSIEAEFIYQFKNVR
jgi:hypothetical protein